MNRSITTLTLLGVPVLLAFSLQEPSPSSSGLGQRRLQWPLDTSLEWGDFDLDGLPDAYAIRAGEGQLLRNLGDGQFADVTLSKCLEDSTSARQARWGDFDGDTWVDLLVVGEDGSLRLFQSEEGKCFVDVTQSQGLAEIGGVLGVDWVDYDRDGRLDLHAVGDGGHLLLHGIDGAPFAPLTLPGAAAQQRVRGVANGQLAAGQGPSAAAGPGASPATPLTGPSSVAAAGPSLFTTPCSAAILDQGTQSCIGASSTPIMGLLYPMSPDFRLDAVGDVFFGDGSDRTTVIQNGSSASLVTADAGGNMYMQVGTDLTPGSSARLLITGMQATPVRASFDADGDVGIGVINPAAQLHIKGEAGQALIRADIDTTNVFEVTQTGRVVTTAVEITGGGDLVEGFETTGELKEPGTVMIIDSEHVGRLRASSVEYDQKVAGVVSGAGGVNHGIRMGQDDVLDGDTLLAMTGRVYVKCSAENGAIRPGDRLTTAQLLGHAMKVTDRERSVGAVIGKAMSSLEEGTGLVLVLVNLQ